MLHALQKTIVKHVSTTELNCNVFLWIFNQLQLGRQLEGSGGWFNIYDACFLNSLKIASYNLNCLTSDLKFMFLSEYKCICNHLCIFDMFAGSLCRFLSVQLSFVQSWKLFRTTPKTTNVFIKEDFQHQQTMKQNVLKVEQCGFHIPWIRH